MVTFELPAVAAILAVAGFGAVVLHVVVWPEPGPKLSQFAIAAPVPRKTLAVVAMIAEHMLDLMRVSVEANRAAAKE